MDEEHWRKENSRNVRCLSGVASVSFVRGFRGWGLGWGAWRGCVYTRFLCPVTVVGFSLLWAFFWSFGAGGVMMLDAFSNGKWQYGIYALRPFSLARGGG